MKQYRLILMLTISALVFSAQFAFAACSTPNNQQQKSEIEVKNDNGIYVFKIPQDHIKNVRPYIVKFLTHNKDVYDQTGAELVINASYFDPKNHNTSSYVIIDEQTVLDPKTNASLMENTALRPHLHQVLNRTEFRVLDCAGTKKYDIRKHSLPPFGIEKTSCKVIHALQAGPELYPTLRLEDEYFVEKKDGKVVRDSISAYKKCARTAIGIKDNDIYIIIATVNHRMTLPELAQYCKSLHLTKAMNFDGGGSTSVDFKGNSYTNNQPLSIISDKDKSARKLKSFLVIN